MIVSGGGARNPTLIALLTAALTDVRPDQRPPRVVTSDAFGLPAEAKEAVAFAVLAYETWHGRPGNDPASTGARNPVVLGDVTPGRLWRRRRGGVGRRTPRRCPSPRRATPRPRRLTRSTPSAWSG